jgi:DNA-binding SARP family transcriptional activator
MIRLSLFGGVALRSADGNELRSVLAQPKRLALLAYLAAATPRTFHSRDTLLALLWPTLDQERARAALRQALYVLRRALGDDVVVTCGDEVIGLDHARLWCDVTAFDDAIDVGDRAVALELYRGELLAGFHVAGALEFERWLDGERARLGGRAAAAAWALSQSAQDAGCLTSALDWSRRLLALAPDDERALRRVVTLLGDLGDRAAAIRTYQAFARRLASDYEIEPTAGTKALIAAIRSATREQQPG